MHFPQAPQSSLTWTPPPGWSPGFYICPPPIQSPNSSQSELLKTHQVKPFSFLECFWQLPLTPRIKSKLLFVGPVSERAPFLTRPLTPSTAVRWAGLTCLHSTHTALVTNPRSVHLGCSWHGILFPWVLVGLAAVSQASAQLSPPHRNLP